MTVTAAQSGVGIVLESEATAASLCHSQCVAQDNLVVTEAVSGSTLQVHGRLDCSAATVTDSMVSLYGSALFGEVCSTKERACELVLFAVPAHLLELTDRAARTLDQKKAQQVEDLSALDGFQEPGRSLTHEDREELMRLQFELPVLEQSIKQLNAKLKELEGTIDQRRYQTVAFERGLAAGVVIRVGETDQRYLVTQRVPGPFVIEYVGDGAAVLMVEGEPVVPLGQHGSLRPVS